MAEKEQQVAFKGIGHWHAQAKAAREHDNVFGALAELARTLSDRHQGPAEAHVHAAEGHLKDSKFAEAAAELRAAARACGPNAQAEADGLRAIADGLPVPEEEPPARAPRRKGEDTDMTEALPELRRVPPDARH